ncbi:BspA family leucine-rich repeat surface protein [Xylocopilactobacillus apis]|uniref:Surface protein n=1 Tax=Xylocopilactobacillus apis TaxID=2932183 RepID=A0AAU9D3B2_9LACO|nr:BspA family leucine-rich repeat surface protein [Xylocopilactobacillus apis]BDR57011.1 hypothetical protein KIMC2_15730 [Xylocopilactobacillus apis]
MNKLVKRLGFFIVAIVSIAAIGIVLNNKQASKAADFPQNTANVNNGSVSRGGRLANKLTSIFSDPLEQLSLPKIQPRGISSVINSTVVTPGSFQMTGQSYWNDTDNRNEVNLTWVPPTNISGGYHVEKDTSPSFTTANEIGTNYGKHFKILNVAPRQLYGPINAATSKWFEQWMKQTNSRGTGPVDMGLFDITTVSLDSYNSDPNSILKNPNGTYKYDGIFFGAIDWNGYQDINETSYQATKAFGDTGRAITFGHDTIEGSADDSHGGDQHSGVPAHTYFNRFASLLGLKVSPAYHFVGSNKLKVATQGSLTKQPYFMDPTQIFSVSPSHSYASYYQYNSGAIRWLKYDEGSLAANHWAGGDAFVTYERDAGGNIIADNNWYLVSKNNYAQIQTGHTTGQCTPQEAEIIFNMIYYTSALNTSTTGKDITVTDDAAPNLPSVASSSSTATSVNLNIDAVDNSTDYYFRARADTSTGDSYSDIIKIPVKSGIKGYIYTVDSAPTGTPTVTRDPATQKVTNINLLPTAGGSTGTITFNRNNDYNKYLHILAVDNNDNVSAVKNISLNEYIWWKYESGTLTIYPHELNANLDTVSNGLTDPTIPNVNWPWNDYLTQINKVVISSGVTSKNSLYGIFAGMKNLTQITGLTNLNTTSVTNMRYMFQNCSSLLNIDVSSFDTSLVDDMSFMFDQCSSLNTIDVTNFDTSQVISMYRMFHFDTNLKNIYLNPTKFNTGNVINFNGLFEGDKNLLSIDVSHFDTHSGRFFEAMFSSCSSLTSLDLHSFDSSNVTNMNWMFYCNSGLTNIDLSSFRTPNLHVMESMFAGCSGLKKLDLSMFDTSNVVNWKYTFWSCTNLTELDLSPLTIKPTADTTSLFLNTPKLWKLKLGGNSKLGNSTSLADPTPGPPNGAINDLDKPVPPNPQYYATNPQWREALTPTTVHAPTGAVRTAAQIATDSQMRNDVRTYVWDQIGTQTLAATPGSIDLGTHMGALRNKEYKSSAQNLKITDNRNVRTGKRWHVEAAVTNPFKLTTDSTKVIRGNPLYYRNSTTGTVTHLLPTAQTLYSETATNTYQDVKNYPWTLSFKASPSDIPKAGRYNATVTFTLVNDTP